MCAKHFAAVLTMLMQLNTLAVLLCIRPLSCTLDATLFVMIFGNVSRDRNVSLDLNAQGVTESTVERNK